MRVAFITNLCERDEPLYPIHDQSLRKSWGDVEAAFHVSGDRADPPKTEHQFFHDFPREGNWSKYANQQVENMAILAERENADYVVKCDTDCVHRSNDWFLMSTQTGDPAMIGFQMRIHPSASYGGCMAIRRDVLQTISGKRYPHPPIMIGDDILITDMVRYHSPNGVHLYPTFSKSLVDNPQRRFSGWAGEEKDYSKFDIVHCGQPGPEEGKYPDERQKIASVKQKMERVHAS